MYLGSENELTAITRSMRVCVSRTDAVVLSPKNPIVGPQVTPGYTQPTSSAYNPVGAWEALPHQVTPSQSGHVGANVSVLCFCLSHTLPQTLTINKLQEPKKQR